MVTQMAMCKVSWVNRKLNTYLWYHLVVAPVAVLLFCWTVMPWAVWLGYQQRLLQERIADVL